MFCNDTGNLFLISSVPNIINVNILLDISLNIGQRLEIINLIEVETKMLIFNYLTPNIIVLRLCIIISVIYKTSLFKITHYYDFQITYSTLTHHFPLYYYCLVLSHH